MLRSVIAALCLLLAGCGEMREATFPFPAPVVTVFTATWCMACKHDADIVDRWEQSGVTVVRVDIDRFPGAAVHERIASVPTYFVRAGNRVIRTQDAWVVDAELRAMNMSQRRCRNCPSQRVQPATDARVNAVDDAEWRQAIGTCQAAIEVVAKYATTQASIASVQCLRQLTARLTEIINNCGV